MSKTDNEEVDETIARVAATNLLNAKKYKAERDRAVALVRAFLNEYPESAEARMRIRAEARAFLKEVDQ